MKGRFHEISLADFFSKTHCQPILALLRPLQDTLKEIDDEDVFDPQTSVIYRMLTSPLGERLVPHYGDGALATCQEKSCISTSAKQLETNKFLKINGCITTVF